MVKKIVLTGGPCSGKTTLLNELESRGHATIRETARDLLGIKKYDPTDISQVVDFQRRVVEEQVRREEKAQAVHKDKEFLILDRGLVDVVAYHNILVKRDGLIDSRMPNRYHLVFVLDRLPFKNDGLRVETGEDEARLIHDEIIAAYKSHGYNIMNIPLLPIKERADFLLAHIQKLKGGENYGWML